MSKWVSQPLTQKRESSHVFEPISPEELNPSTTRLICFISYFLFYFIILNAHNTTQRDERVALPYWGNITFLPIYKTHYTLIESQPTQCHLTCEPPLPHKHVASDHHHVRSRGRLRPPPQEIERRFTTTTTRDRE